MAAPSNSKPVSDYMKKLLNKYKSTPPSNSTALTPTPASVLALADSETISPAMARILERRKRLGLHSAAEATAASAPKPIIDAPKPVYSAEKTEQFMILVQLKHTTDDVLIKLITEGADPYKIAEDGYLANTPFSYAIKYNKLPTAEYIISQGIDSSVILNSKVAPIKEAIRTKNIPAIKLLLDKYTPLIASDLLKPSSLNRPVMNALFSNIIDTKNIEILELFFDPSIPVHMFTDTNDFYMYFSGQKNFPEALLFFLNRGANPNYIPHHGYTALEHAISRQYLDIIKILLEKGAIVPLRVRDSLISLPHTEFNEDLLKVLAPYISRQEEFPIPATTIIANNRSVTRPLKTFEIMEEDGIPILTIPQGSLLYNSFYVGEIRSPATGKLDLNAILQTLGGILPFATTVTETATGLKISSCIDKFSQKFFYTNPAGGAALKKIHADKTFNVTSTFQAKRDMRFALLMSPGPYHRLGESHEGITDRPHADLYPCSLSEAESCECAKLIQTPTSNAKEKDRIRKGEKCKFGFGYDACIRPKFLKDHNLDGHIAIADADSYDSLLRSFEDTVRHLIIAEKYKTLTDIIFTACLSADERGADLPTRGFPELVIQIFGTDWYEGKNSIQFEHEIPIGDDKSDDAKIHALVRFLIGFNALPEPTTEIPVQSALQLIRTSTYTRWYNFETGISKDSAPVTDLTPLNSYIRYYLNSLEAFESGDLKFIIDPRTGFLVRPGFLPPVQFVEDSEDTIYSYETICEGTSDIGINELVKSANARIMDKSDWSFVWDTDKKEHMLEHVDNDMPEPDYDNYENYNDIDLSGGAPIATRRMPNIVKRQARPKRFNKTQNKGRLNMIAVANTRRNNRARVTKAINLDDVYGIYMDEIKKAKLAYDAALKTNTRKKKGGSKSLKRKYKRNHWKTHKNTHRY